MRIFNLRFDRLCVTIMILFGSTIWISSVSAMPQQQTSLGVKIIDPAKGQQVAIGRNLTISGTSSYNATSSCAVFVIVDGIRPYQNTTPIGQAGGNDYSKWKYTLTPAYVGTIKEGINRITAKLVCQASPTPLMRFYSINVIGTSNVPPNNTTTVVPLSYLFHPTPLISHLSVPTDSTSSSSASSDSSGGAGRGHHHHHHQHHHGGSSGSYSSGPGGGYDEGPGGGYDEGPGGGYFGDYP
jgi:hypothetical protein